MANKRKGLLTVSREYAVHLRKWGKRMFWKKERKEGKKVIKDENSKKDRS